MIIKRLKNYFLIILLSFLRLNAGFVSNDNTRIITTKELSNALVIKAFDHETRFINAKFNETYDNYTVSQNNTVVFMFNYIFESNQTWAVRLSTSTESRDATIYPVLFSVRQEKGISSWQIPMIFRNTYKYQHVSRTLCPFQNYPVSYPVQKQQHIYVDVSSQTPDNAPIEFTITATNLTDFLIKPGETKTLTISPSEPVFVQYTFPPDEDVILIHATSEDSSCAVISLQEIQCPVYDLDKNVEFSGYYQTMSRQAGITVSKNQDFKSGSFYIVFVLKPYDRDCSGFENIVPSGQKHERLKTVNLKISPKITKNEYYIAIFGIFAIFALVYVLSIVLAIFYFIKEIRNPSERSLLEDQEVQRPLHTNQTSGYGTVSPSRNPFDSRMKDPCNSFDDASGSADTRSLDDGDSLDETDVDMLDDADHEKDVFRTKTFLFVADLARKKQKKLSKKSALYTRNILIIAIFYGIPVVQLVYTYQKVLHITGDQDICYYNFLCAHPFYVFTDFNHVFSNVGYVLLGILFIGLVWRRDIMYKRTAKVNPRLDKYFGIPRHNGLYYAMGLALIMEGVLSGSYHVCPNFSNFQFDTTFMYIIASLCMLKIYQSRHPDINANSHSSCFIFAIVVLVGVIGVFDGGSPYFWVAFCSLEALCCLLLSIQVYYMGRWRLNWGIFKRIYLTLRNDLCTHFTRPMYPDRLMLLLIANVANWALLAYGLAVQLRDFGTFLLAIFIINLFLYIIFYIIMKLRYQEKILFQPLLYIILSCVTWGTAMYFFLHKNVSWQQTPAQSREKNHPCLVLHFYDVHDIWHFLSSAALFFSFMVLLTLDDDLVYVPRERIPVF